MICSVSFASVAFMRVSVTLFVPSLGCIPTDRSVTLSRDLGRFRILPAGPPYIWSRAPRWPLSCYLMYLCDSGMFFHYILPRVSCSASLFFFTCIIFFFESLLNSYGLLFLLYFQMFSPALCGLSLTMSELPPYAA